MKSATPKAGRSNQTAAQRTVGPCTGDDVDEFLDGDDLLGVTDDFDETTD